LKAKGVIIEVTASTVTATFTGEAVFTANADTDASYVITAACTKSVACNYSFTTNGNGASAVPVSKNGTTGALTAFTISDTAAQLFRVLSKDSLQDPQSRLLKIPMPVYLKSQ
jgi:hypothetical protein